MSDHIRVEVFEYYDQVPAGLPLAELETLRKFWIATNAEKLFQLAEYVRAGVVDFSTEKIGTPGRSEEEYAKINRGSTEFQLAFRGGHYIPAIADYEKTCRVLVCQGEEIFGRIRFCLNPGMPKIIETTDPADPFIVPSRTWTRHLDEILQEGSLGKKRIEETADEEDRRHLENLLKIITK